ncbi:uncharacterized protein L969DRAFT_94579 [Mixia osmundae IAM 14324]|uniref:Transcription factor CBF/NF-Y/archaeal histone domain-containing protein n=1 Tax=Mixia osmundae (strain CBS 9802 / IAM 14324 / JCM 22182 / KY 12970) TaxID=764103 RepID=G7DVM4_MIXOS|nr:uncharacterized protein L969DRAFT_94579 [Mixia osmundae IAM 14324]KEI39522.1 hypothetical protein L969DRAFT_94579 [Mixia osmundae IAM 14324]GAA94634.1 hypothetical protein E5Q_01286 [Mixia osmundae IAM 14324]
MCVRNNAQLRVRYFGADIRSLDHRRHVHSAPVEHCRIEMKFAAVVALAGAAVASAATFTPAVFQTRLQTVGTDAAKLNASLAVANLTYSSAYAIHTTALQTIKDINNATATCQNVTGFTAANGVTTIQYVSASIAPPTLNALSNLIKKKAAFDSFKLGSLAKSDVNMLHNSTSALAACIVKQITNATVTPLDTAFNQAGALLLVSSIADSRVATGCSSICQREVKTHQTGWKRDTGWPSMHTTGLFLHAFPPIPSTSGSHAFGEEEISNFNAADLTLPIACISSLMKSVVGEIKVAKDAKQCMQECVSEFIAFLASEAAEYVETSKRRCINAEDLLRAMKTLGFDNYAEISHIHLAKLRELMMTERPKRKKGKLVDHQRTATDLSQTSTLQVASSSTSNTNDAVLAATAALQEDSDSDDSLDRDSSNDRHSSQSDRVDSWRSDVPWRCARQSSRGRS